MKNIVEKCISGIQNVRNAENIVLFFVQIKGWSALYRIEETKLVCAISRKLIFGWIFLFNIGGPKMVLK